MSVSKYPVDGDDGGYLIGSQAVTAREEDIMEVATAVGVDNGEPIAAEAVKSWPKEPDVADVAGIDYPVRSNSPDSTQICLSTATP